MESSLESYHLAVELNPESSAAISELADAYKNKEQYDKAISYYFKALSLQPEDTVVFDNMAAILIKYCKMLVGQNNLEQLIAVYKDFISQELCIPHKIDKIDEICAIFGKSIQKIGVRNRDLNLAITFFQTATSDYFYKEWSYYHLGYIFGNQNKIDRAITCYETALEIRPDFPTFLLSLGELLLENNKNVLAFRCGLKILRCQGGFPRDVRANNTLVNLLSVNPKNAKLQTKLEKVINKAERFNIYKGSKKLTYKNLGRVLEKRGKVPEAIEYYQSSLNISLKKSKPEFTKHHWKKGNLKGPDFLIIGFGKCGTTSLYSYLRQHPQVLSPITKEPSYLNRLVNSNDFPRRDWSLPSPEKDFYQGHFAPREDNSSFITGEASTTNFVPGCDQIIANWVPKIKLIVLLRDPVSRTISHYEQTLKGKRQNQTLEEAINKELAELETASNIAETVCSKVKAGWEENIAMSLYVYPLERWMNTFPKNQFLILNSEDLIHYPQAVMNQTYEFLGLSPSDSVEFSSKNIGSYPQIDARLISRLSNFFQPHNQRLEQLLGRKFYW